MTFFSFSISFRWTGLMMRRCPLVFRLLLSRSPSLLALLPVSPSVSRRFSSFTSQRIVLTINPAFKRLLDLSHRLYHHPSLVPHRFHFFPLPYRGRSSVQRCRLLPILPFRQRCGWGCSRDWRWAWFVPGRRECLAFGVWKPRGQLLSHKIKDLSLLLKGYVC